MGRAVEAAAHDATRLDAEAREHRLGRGGATRNAFGQDQGQGPSGRGGARGGTPPAPALLQQGLHPGAVHGGSGAQASGRTGTGRGRKAQVGYRGRHRAAQVNDNGMETQTLENHLGDQGR